MSENCESLSTCVAFCAHFLCLMSLFCTSLYFFITNCILFQNVQFCIVIAITVARYIAKTSRKGHKFDMAHGCAYGQTKRGPSLIKNKSQTENIEIIFST